MAHPNHPSSLTGSPSGSASPLTRYGSFPPPPNSTEEDQHQPLKAVNERLQNSLLGKGRSSNSGKKSSRQSLHPAGQKWDWETPAKVAKRRPSSTSLLGPASGAVSREPDVYDSDADLITTDEDEEVFEDDSGESTERPPGSGRGFAAAASGDDILHRTRSGYLRRGRGEGVVRGQEEDKQWGVIKMEAMGRFRSKRGLMGIYAGVYLMSIITSLEGNTVPTIEPYFLSLLKSHSLLGAIAIVTNIAYAVGKPPLTKVLDVFGRAEGIILASGLWCFGFLLTALATDVRVFIVARAIAALGGQGLQLSQQIIIADTSTLTNRGLITSTISLPWLVTTWLGPPLGAWFQSAGPKGYRIAYALFGLLLPVTSSVLIVTLLGEWRKTKARLYYKSTPPISPSVAENGTASARYKGSPEDDLVREQHSVKSWKSKVGQLWRALDVVGLVALTFGCIFVLLPLTLAAKRPASWADVEIYVYIIGGVACLVFFALYEFNYSPIPLLPPRLVFNRTIMCGSALGFFHFLSQFVYESFFTSFLQVARHHSPVDASYISQSYIFSASIAAILAGLFAKLTQRYKWIGIAGVIVHMIGTWLMMRARNLDSSTFELVLSQVIGGIGGGWTTIAGQIGCQSVVGHQDVGIATAIFLTITSIGGAVGGALAGAVWSTLLPSSLRQHLPSSKHDLIPDIMASLSYTLSFPAGDEVRNAIDLSYVTTQRRLNWVSIFALIPALIAVLGMKNVHLEKEDQGQGDGVVVLGRASILRDEEAGDSETSSLLGGTSEHETTQVHHRHD